MTCSSRRWTSSAGVSRRAMATIRGLLRRVNRNGAGVLGRGDSRGRVGAARADHSGWRGKTARANSAPVAWTVPSEIFFAVRPSGFARPSTVAAFSTSIVSRAFEITDAPLRSACAGCYTAAPHGIPTMNRAWPNEFHVSRAVRERCGFGETLFASSGVAVLAHPAAAQRFAAALDAGLGRARQSSAAELFAMGLLDEAAHLLIAHWQSRHDPNGLRDALVHLEGTLGRPAVDGLLLAFIEAFPPRAVHRGEQRAADWLASAEPAPAAGTTAKAVARTHREVALEELLLLWLENA